MATLRNTTTRRYVLELPTGQKTKSQSGHELDEFKTVILHAQGDSRGKNDPLKDKGVPAHEYPLSKDELAWVKKNPGIMALVNTHRHLQLVA